MDGSLGPIPSEEQNPYVELAERGGYELFCRQYARKWGAACRQLGSRSGPACDPKQRSACSSALPLGPSPMAKMETPELTGSCMSVPDLRPGSELGGTLCAPYSLTSRVSTWLVALGRVRARRAVAP